jgi:hypothetical protein
MTQPIRRIAISTGGGDAPGLNAVISSVVWSAANRGWECLGIRDGFNGILRPEHYPQGGVERLSRDRVRGISHLGGTILGTTNKGHPFHFPTRQPDGSVVETDRSGELMDYFRREGIDALVMAGGDGTLQVCRFKGDPMAVIERINALGYGLTLGIQTRIDSRAQALAAAARVGNVYVNRNMIGAVVGVQPFGGEGLIGTGPKAGGPHYLLRFCAEQTLTINTTAAGGNVALFV